jgi:hypothetical protein
MFLAALQFGKKSHNTKIVDSIILVIWNYFDFARPWPFWMALSICFNVCSRGGAGMIAYFRCKLMAESGDWRPMMAALATRLPSALTDSHGPVITLTKPTALSSPLLAD